MLFLMNLMLFSKWKKKIFKKKSTFSRCSPTFEWYCSVHVCVLMKKPHCAGCTELFVPDVAAVFFSLCSAALLNAINSQIKTLVNKPSDITPLL